MNICDIIVLILIIAAVSWAVRSILRQRKNGRSCCGNCPQCDNCQKTNKTHH